MIAGGDFGATAALLSAIFGGLGAAGGLGTGIASALQDAPEPAKPSLPSAAQPSPVAAAAPAPGGAFMGRQNTDTDNRKSTALAMLGR